MSESSVNPIDWRYFWVDSKENEEKMKSDAFWHLLIYLWVSNILAKKIQWSMLNNSSGKLELNSTEQKKRVFFIEQSGNRFLNDVFTLMMKSKRIVIPFCELKCENRAKRSKYSGSWKAFKEQKVCFSTSEKGLFAQNKSSVIEWLRGIDLILDLNCVLYLQFSTSFALDFFFFVLTYRKF